jgi:WD40 repeat protein
LQLVGLSQTEWNNQISCIIYPKTQAYTLACSDNKFAVGLSDGSVRLYNETTCQEELSVAHGEPVRHLALANTNMHLAAADRKKITMWDPFTGTLLWTATAPEILLAIEFNDIDTTLMMKTRSEYMIFWRVDNGEEEDRRQFEEVFEEVPSDRENKQRPAKLAANYRRPPNLTVFSAELNLLAVGYRARPVGFWDLEDSSYVGQSRRNLDEFQPPVVALVFNPNLDLSLAAAAYQDGTVLTFDPRTQQRHGDTGLVNSSVLASSPDGTILASGDHAGVITLFDFETSRVLYRVSSLEHNVRQISFSSTGLRFYDIRGDRCIVWEPSVLVRRNDDSSFGFSEVVPMGPEVTTNRTTDDDLAITTMWHITAAIISSVAVKMEL